MPEIVYSEDEMIMAMLLYGGIGDGYESNGEGSGTVFGGESDYFDVITRYPQ